MEDLPEKPLPRFAAKLLFQFRAVKNGASDTMRLCEERFVVFRAPDARKALAMARRRGKSEQYRYRNDEGAIVHFEFVGIMDLLDLDPQCDEDEVWYTLSMRKLPMERADDLLLPESRFRALGGTGR